MSKYEILVSDIRLFKLVVEAESEEELLEDDWYLGNYSEIGELVEIRDPQVDDIELARIEPS